MSDPEGESEGILGSVRQPKGSPESWESQGVRSPRCESGDKLGLRCASEASHSVQSWVVTLTVPDHA